MFTRWANGEEKKKPRHYTLLIEKRCVRVCVCVYKIQIQIGGTLQRASISDKVTPGLVSCDMKEISCASGTRQKYEVFKTSNVLNSCLLRIVEIC